MNRYALVDKDGLVVNVVLWDGTPSIPPVVDEATGEVTEAARGWDPPEGLTAVRLDDEHPAGPGDTIDTATTEVVARVEPAPLDVEARLAALEAQLDEG